MGGGSDTTQNTQSQSVQQLPPWINQAAQQNYGFAQNVANQPLQQYQGQMVADVGPQMQQSWNTAATGGNAGQDQYNAAQAGYLGVMGQQPQQVTAGQLSNTNLQPYMNPYTQSVINSTLPIMQQQLGLQQNQQQNAANASNAFGGSRQAVQQGVTQAQGAQNMAQMAAQLNQANYGQAVQGAQGDIQSRMQAALANQAAQQNQGNLNLQAASGMGALGNQAQLSQVRNFTEQMTAGQMQQAQAQQQINAQMAKFQNAANYPNQQLSILQSALGMTPYEQGQQSSSTQETQTAANPMQEVMGGLDMAKSLMGMFAPVPGASDRRLKTDITRVGSKMGVPIHAYRYKGDPKSYPKVVGPMAEDVAKTFGPAAVAKIPGSGGKMAVHPAVMGALAAPRGYAQGTDFVQPDMEQIDKSYFQRGKVPDDLAGIADPTPSGSAGLKALLDRGYAYPSKARGYAQGTPFVQPNLDPAETDMGTSDPETESNMRWHAAAQQWYDYVHNRGKEGPTKQYAFGVARVPGRGLGDSVPAMLTPGEAVLNRHAASHLGRHNIAALNALAGPAMGPPVPAGPMGGPGPNLAAIAGARPPMGAMAPPVAAGGIGPNLAAIAAGGQGPLAAPRMIKPRRLRVALAQPRGALAGG